MKPPVTISNREANQTNESLTLELTSQRWCVACEVCWGAISFYICLHMQTQTPTHLLLSSLSFLEGHIKARCSKERNVSSLMVHVSSLFRKRSKTLVSVLKRLEMPLSLLWVITYQGYNCHFSILETRFLCRRLSVVASRGVGAVSPLCKGGRLDVCWTIVINITWMSPQ